MSSIIPCPCPLSLCSVLQTSILLTILYLQIYRKSIYTPDKLTIVSDRVDIILQVTNLTLLGKDVIVCWVVGQGEDGPAGLRGQVWAAGGGSQTADCAETEVSCRLVMKASSASLHCNNRSTGIDWAFFCRSQLAIETRLSSLDQQLRDSGQQLLTELATHHDSWQVREWWFVI